MKTSKVSLILFIGSLSLSGCSKKSGKNNNTAPNKPTLPENSLQLAEKVVPTDYSNDGSGVDDVKTSLSAQTAAIKGPGSNLGLDGTSNPKVVIHKLTSKGVIGRVVTSVMGSDRTLSLAGPARSTTTPSSEKGVPSIDMTSCDSFFTGVDQVIDSGLKTVRSALESINEDQILKIEGISKGERLPNEAFRYNLNDEKTGTKATLSGGSNETSAFLKASGEFKVKAEITSEATMDQSPFPGEPSNPVAPEKKDILDGDMAMTAAVLVDSKTNLMRAGGGFAILGKTENGPMSAKASSFVELAGGATPGVSLELTGEFEGKADANASTMKVSGDARFSLAQAADKSFLVSLKSNFTGNDGKDSATNTMTMSSEMVVENGRCVVKKVTCDSIPATSCQSIHSWEKAPREF